MEAEATFTVQQVAATAFLLYMCKPPSRPYLPSFSLTCLAAPFAIDLFGKIF